MPSILQTKTLGALTLAVFAAAALSTAATAQTTNAPAPMFDFAAIDSDKDGSITKEEMAAYHAAQIALADTDKDGFLSPAELAAHHQAAMAGRGEDRAARMIKRLDSDGDGALSLAEAQEGPNARMFARLDRDDDGVISADEATNAKMYHGGKERGGKERGGHHSHFWK
jgi:Ca2+-binding EF-hand superfamily protein